MKAKAIPSVLAALVAWMLLGAPAFAQVTSDPTAGTSEPVPIVSGGENADVIFNPVFRTLGPSGNQDWVRQYDRKSYPFLDLGGFRWDVLSKDKATFFRVQLRDIASSDWQRGSLFLDSRYVRFEGDYDALYHRMGVFRQSRVLNGQVDVAFTTNPNANAIVAPGGTTGTNFLNENTTFRELNPGDSYFVARNTKNFGVRVGPFNGPIGDRSSLRFNWWNQDQSGQQLFRTRNIYNLATGALREPAGEHPTTWFTRGISRTTNDIAVGFDTGYGPVGLRYRYLIDDFVNNDPDIPLIVSAAQGVGTLAAGTAARTTWQFPNYDGNGHSVLGSLRLGDWGSAYIDYLAKDRKNSVTGYKYDFSNVAAGFNARLTDFLFSVNYSSYDRNTVRNPGYTVLFPTNPANGADVNNLANGILDVDRSRLGFDVRYTGFRKYNLGFGYRTETSHRRNDLFRAELDQDHEDIVALGFIEEPNLWNPSSTKDTWYLHLGGNPTDWLDFNVDYRSTDANRDDFTRGVPGDRDSFTVDVNLYPMDWWTVYANYQDVTQKGNQYLYRDDNTTWTVGTSVNPIRGLGLGLFYTAEDGKQATNYFWGGTSAGRRLLFTPQLDAPYDYDSDTLGINALATLTEGVRLSGNYTTTTSRGTLPTTIFNTETLLSGPAVAPIAQGLAGNTITEWNPLNIDSNRLDLGLEWDLTKSQTLRFDYITGTWKDHTLNYADGSYSSVWASWTGRW